MEQLNIENIYKYFRLLTKVNNENYAQISELAHELGVKKTKLMDFIENNYKLFYTANEYENNKNLGLCITKIFLKAEDNPRTYEYAMKMKEKYKNTIFISQINNYNKSIGCQVLETPHSEYRYNYLWENTKEKVDLLKKLNILKDIEITVGYGSDTQWKTVNNTLVNGWENILKENNLEYIYYDDYYKLIAEKRA